MNGRNNYHRRLFEQWKFKNGGICPHCHKPIESYHDEQIVRSEHLTGGCLPIIVAS